MSACAGLGSPLRNRPAMMRLRSSRHALLPAALRGCGAPRIRCVLDHVAARIAASPPPIGTVLAAGNAIAAAAEAAGGTGAAHAAVGSTLAQVAVTAVAIASGACLSTKVDFLWPRVEQRPDSQILEGVDVTEYPIFKEIKVQKAIAFASKAHLTQFRKTGEPYVTHCIHTGKILAALVPMGGDRAVNTVVAGILHDVIDDTLENFRTIEGEFGDDVAHLVAGVSKLSYINQLLRRHRRESINQNTLSSEEANNLRVMLLGMVDDPRVVLIKLADRLHNMRTIYALSTPKAQAVAQETLAVWCSLASRLGVWALKAELEDLCFAVLQPQTFRMIRAELASMWAPGNKVRQLRKLSTKANLLPHSKDDCTILPENWPVETNEGENMKDLLQAVLPFDLLLDRRKRANFLNNLRKLSESPDGITKGISDSVIALSSLAVCEEALERELHISTSYIPGMEVSLSSRLKSLYSVYSKMRRKGVGIKQIYDARALRVIVGDQNGKLHGPAVKNCYYLLEIVHKLWTPIDGEFDDYIINPKPSGYQSLHTAVQGPDNTPLEVQIRTQRMHEHAEFGLAAHWLYKENKVDHINTSDSAATLSPYQTNISEHEVYTQDESSWKYSAIKTGHPVLRVEGSQLLAAVVVNIDNDGRELLIAVSFLEASEAVADRRSSSQMNRWEIFAKLYKKVSEQWWFAPGHGDWCTCLEKYTLCRDGIFHKQDQFQRLLPTYIQIIDLMEQEEAEYWMVVSALFEGKELVAVPSVSNFDKSTFNSSTSALLDDEVTNKVHFLRAMLQWEEQVLNQAALREKNRRSSLYSESNHTGLGEVAIIRWPHGEIMRMKSGSTAADAARRIGLDGKLVRVNGQLVLPHTQLKDGDIIEVRM
ncbi:uncharacterized protein LOC122001615 isoform X1 [Zingiber officinale]|uniref:uncharacterized protein LOC122001614 isoform X1 n=1 Tax=Zingiber officinale TaxID=94328 RepID=UPI001C4C2C23|nr:uncharacterized protein LOC122001614 isoform X1 [Zingiber officinale]XP_042412384.1 uncharacterized protein LOC122001615 isoform X1 [Zingiber officinale]